MPPRRDAFYVFLVAFCLAASGCQRAASEAPRVIATAETGGHGSHSADPSTPTRSDPPAPKYLYADPATGNSIRLMSINLDTVGDAAEHPDPGMMYVILHVVVQSRNAATPFNPDDVEVVTRGGAVEEQTDSIPERYHPFEADVVPDMARRSGDLGFQVPRTARSITVTWNDDSNLDPPPVIAVYRLR